MIDIRDDLILFEGEIHARLTPSYSATDRDRFTRFILNAESDETPELVYEKFSKNLAEASKKNGGLFTLEEIKNAWATA